MLEKDDIKGENVTKLVRVFNYLFPHGIRVITCGFGPHNLCSTRSEGTYGVLSIMVMYRNVDLGK